MPTCAAHVGADGALPVLCGDHRRAMDDFCEKRAIPALFRLVTKRFGDQGAMGDYSESIIVQVSADRLFAYLSDVQHLPSYMPRLSPRALITATGSPSPPTSPP